MRSEWGCTQAEEVNAMGRSQLIERQARVKGEEVSASLRNSEQDFDEHSRGSRDVALCRLPLAHRAVALDAQKRREPGLG